MEYFGEIDTLSKTLSFHAKRNGKSISLVSGGNEVSYEDLEIQSNRSARALMDDGCHFGSRVAYIGKECLAYYELLFACAKSKSVFVPINWKLTEHEIEHILRDSRPEIVFVDGDSMKLVKGIQSKNNCIKKICVVGDIHEFSDWRNGFSGSSLNNNIFPDDPVVQLYTSGTTGLPKGVVLAHRSFFAVRDALYEAGLKWIDWEKGDVSLIGIPGFHVGGLWWAVQGFNAGITNISMPTFISTSALALIKTRGVTTMCVVPSMIQMFLSEYAVTADCFSTLRKVVYGGSPISETLLGRAINLMECEFAQIYGLTETGNTAVCLPPESHGVARLMQAAGRPYPGFEIKIVNEEGQIEKSDSVGEIYIKTPSAMLEYWGMENETKSVLKGEWIVTGDVGYMDLDGYLYVCDRLKDTIIIAGENVYPAEVENILSRHSAILECAVVGIPDKNWGEAILACIVIERDEKKPRFSQIIQWMRTYLADFKIPSRFEIVESIPRNASGKILRRSLREKHWSGRDRLIN